MYIQICFLQTFLALMLVGPIAVNAQSNVALHQMAARYQSEFKVPAVAIALIRPDTIYIGIAGSKQVGQQMPIGKDDLFHIGSNTKAFTSLLAAYLVEQGHINWTDSLLQIVPELDLPENDAYRGVTLEQLLSHRAGIAPYESADSKEFRAVPKDIQLMDDPRLVFAKVALSFAPASSKDQNHLYSNGGYILAALMLERATRTSFEELLIEMGEKLGLTLRFGFPIDEENEVVLGHRKSFLGFLLGKRYHSLDPNNSFSMPKYFRPAGDVAISVSDFAIWVQYHLRGLVGHDHFISSENYQKLHYGFPDYGLGWYNGLIGGGPERFSYHGGSLGTFSSAVMLSATRKTGIVILVNAESKQVQQLKQTLRIELWERFGQSLEP
ncbi:MAG: beta-lactamase family protein [Saprospiraceae bacterium]|nr:beta-lactamase family protein [Saprospiraceae bacterium]